MRISDWSSACALPISPGFFEAYGQWMGTPPPSWDDLRWLRDQWDGPFMLKGIMRVSDARRAVDAGYSAISVSNHGGNNLDTTPPPPHPPPPNAHAGPHPLDHVMDGGIRRGREHGKAIALRPHAVLHPRATPRALAPRGQPPADNRPP